MRKNCKLCKDYKKLGDEKDAWRCSVDLSKNLPTKCYLIQILLILTGLTSILTEGAKHQKKIFPKVEKMLDDVNKEIDEGNEWKNQN